MQLQYQIQLVQTWWWYAEVSCGDSRKSIVKYSIIWGEIVVKLWEKLAMLEEFMLWTLTNATNSGFFAW